MDAGRPLADWRSATDYEILASGDRYVFAWEWLRRSPVYSAGWIGGRPDSEAEAFGLHRFEPTNNGVSTARPVWRFEVDPQVILATATSASGEPEAFDFAAIDDLSTCVVGPTGIEHWLWSDGIRHVRLDVIGGTLRRGPVRLEYRLAGFRSVLPHLVTIDRLVTLTRTGRLEPRLFSPARRVRRWTMILRTHDALMAGASQRDIAEHLLGLGNPARWRITAPSVRQQVQRLVIAARAAANIDPSHWLSDA